MQTHRSSRANVTTNHITEVSLTVSPGEAAKKVDKRV